VATELNKKQVLNKKGFVFMELNYNAPTLHQRLKKRWPKALTLIELLIAIAIMGILSAIAVPIWTGYMDDSRNATAIADIANIESQIERFVALNGNPPATLAAANIVPPKDPWGRAYIYVYPPVYWDKHDKPLNKDYDILSMGKDGKTNVHLWHSDAFDDIIRCNSGAFVGLGKEY
jgi:general secretion pathway protein G